LRYYIATYGSVEEALMGDATQNSVRLVVTGHDEEGRATAVADGPVAGTVLPTGTVLHQLWGRDEAPALPDDRPSASDSPFPPPGGFRFGVLTVPPGYESSVHATSTVDCGVVVAGELSLALEDGIERPLRVGDAFVQNGTTHAWRNRGDDPAVVVLFIAGAHHG
jgi:quercetin dioxygenase-like cupin family protein